MQFKKNQWFCFLALFLINAVYAFADPVEVPSPIKAVYIPEGFDSNDVTEVILYGEFPDTCYKVGSTSYHIEGKTVYIKATALKYSEGIGGGCKEMLVPFTQVVRVGILRAGTYTIKREVVSEEPTFTKTMTVKAATVRSADDFLYAPVSGVDIVENSRDSHKLLISGFFPMLFTGCMRIDEVKHYLSTGPVLVVQPIAKVLKDSECTDEDAKLSYQYEITLNDDLPHDQDMLIHVRALDGNSVNRVMRLIHK